MSKLSRLLKASFKRNKKINDIILSEKLNGIETLSLFWDESQYDTYFQQRISKRKYRGTLTFREWKKLWKKPMGIYVKHCREDM